MKKAILGFSILITVSIAQATPFTFTTLDDPNALQGYTYATGINDSGQVVGSGYSSDYTGNHGFVYSGGTFTTFKIPGSEHTQASAINNLGQIAGTYSSDALGDGSFVYNASNYTILNKPGAHAGFTFAKGINNNGLVVGYYYDGVGTRQHGFLYGGGTYATLNDPNATLYTSAKGINNLGHVVGSYGDATSSHGFIYIDGTYVTLNDPNATDRSIGTQANGINDRGQVVGSYGDATGIHGFLYEGNTFTTFDHPDATGITYLSGINSRGQIVGYYSDGRGAHGFVASPVPEPSVLWVFGAGLLGLIVARRKAA